MTFYRKNKYKVIETRNKQQWQTVYNPADSKQTNKIRRENIKHRDSISGILEGLGIKKDTVIKPPKCFIDLNNI